MCGERERGVFFKDMAGMEEEREERACMERERERAQNRYALNSMKY